MSVLVNVLLLCRDTMTTATLIMKNILLELAYSFKDFVYYQQSSKPVDNQTKVLEKKLKVLYPDM